MKIFENINQTISDESEFQFVPRNFCLYENIKYKKNFKLFKIMKKDEKTNK